MDERGRVARGHTMGLKVIHGTGSGSSNNGHTSPPPPPPPPGSGHREASLLLASTASAFRSLAKTTQDAQFLKLADSFARSSERFARVAAVERS
jgi:hypothetical protein